MSETARLEIQISLMGKTQERQRKQIQDQAETQRDLLDSLANVEARLDIALKLMNQEASAFMICHYEDERREQGL